MIHSSHIQQSRYENNQNVFAFDSGSQNDSQQFQQQQVQNYNIQNCKFSPTSQLKQSQLKRNFNQLKQIGIFVFDQDQNISQSQDVQQNVKQKTCYQNEGQSSEFEDIKKRILFKSVQNNLLYENFNKKKNTENFQQNNQCFQKSFEQQYQDRNENINKQQSIPNVLTRQFQTKVKNVRNSIKENVSIAPSNINNSCKSSNLKTNFIDSNNQKSNASTKIQKENSNDRKIKPEKFQERYSLQEKYSQSQKWQSKEPKSTLSNSYKNKQLSSSQSSNQSTSLNIEVQGAKIYSNVQKQQQIQYLQEQKALKVTNMKQFLFTQLSEQYKINVIIKKAENDGFWDKMVQKTKYYVLIEQNNKFLFSVTKDGFNKWIFSMNKDDTCDRNKNYLGKMMSKDFNNSEFILYDHGFDPKQTKSLQFCHKQVASIKYQESSGPRKFNVILSTNNKGYHSIQDEVNILQQKWTDKKQRKKLCKIYSKQPQFDQSDRNYKLDFKGMLGKASIKNFILSSQQYENSLIFARRTQDTYGMQVKHPFSLIQAVAVCISSIFHKSLF